MVGLSLPLFRSMPSVCRNTHQLDQNHRNRTCEDGYQPTQDNARLLPNVIPNVLTCQTEKLSGITRIWPGLAGQRKESRAEAINSFSALTPRRRSVIRIT